jgi:hypothetical protein
MKTYLVSRLRAWICVSALSITTSAYCLESYVGVIQSGPLTNMAGGRVNFDTPNLVPLVTGPVTGKVFLASQVTTNPSLSVNPLLAFPLTGTAPSFNFGTGTYQGTLSTATSVVPPVTVAYEIDPNNHRLITAGCSVTRNGLSSPFEGWKKTPQPSNMLGLYNMVLPGSTVGSTTQPDGVSWAYFTVASSGTYMISGRTACDEAFTCSAFVGPDIVGKNLALFAMQASKSSLCGTARIDGTAMPNYIKNSTIKWNRPPNSTNLYQGGFNVALGVDGGRYTPTTFALSTWINAHFSSLTANLNFTAIGLPAAFNPNRTITAVQVAAGQVTSGGGIATAFPNAANGPAMTSIKLNYLTGRMVTTAPGCKFTLKDYSNVTYQNVSRLVNYSGIVYPTTALGTFGGAAMDGYFKLTFLPVSLVMNPPVFSGKVTLR